MNPESYKPTPVTAKKRKPRKTGITYPAILTPDTGIHTVQTLLPEKKYKIWYQVDGRKHYVTLPKGTTIEDARTRRDRLYENLRTRYRATRRTPKTSETQPRTNKVRVTPGKYIYERPPFIVKIRGKQICEAGTHDEAEAKRDAWLKENSALVPHVLIGGAP